jgi:hypothetical protein
MGTQPTLTPAQLAQEQYTAFANGFAGQNQATIAAAQPGQQISILIPSLPAITAVYVAFASGQPITTAMLAAQVTTFTYVPVPLPPTPPEYALTSVIVPSSVWGVMTQAATWPAPGTVVDIGGKNYALYPDDAGLGEVAVLQTAPPQA